jgi:hypothetical protein
MKGKVFLLAALVAVGTCMYGQDKSADLTKQVSDGAQPMQSTWVGYLVDTKYAAQIASNPASAKEQAAEYTRAQALQAEQSGFGIIAEGQWLKFDEQGNKLVAGLLKKTTTEKGIMVAVTGSLNGDALTVTSLEEYKATDPRYPRLK